MDAWARALAWDAALRATLRAHGPRALRLSLAAVFLYLGALKAFGASATAGAIQAMVYFGDPATFVVLLGYWEMTIGLGLLFRRVLRLTLLLLWLQLAGTLLVFVLRPWAVAGAGPASLSLAGELAVLNLVLIAAGLVVAGTVEPPLASGRAPEAGARRVERPGQGPGR